MDAVLDQHGQALILGEGPDGPTPRLLGLVQLQLSEEIHALAFGPCHHGVRSMRRTLIQFPTQVYLMLMYQNPLDLIVNSLQY